jgi:hypothetical protein
MKRTSHRPSRLVTHDPLDGSPTECIGKGKASAPYAFGVKISIVTNQ